jgi:hypothetical protein
VSAIADTLGKIAQSFLSGLTISGLEVLMSGQNRKKGIVRVNTARVSVETELAPVAWVGWQIRPGEKYFGVIQRADASVERTRLERDDLQAAADFVTAHKLGNAASIHSRKLRRVRSGGAS